MKSGSSLILVLLATFLIASCKWGGNGEGTSPAPAGGVSDLPLVEVKAGSQTRQAIAIILTGDGGWAYFIRRIATQLADSGVSSVGLNSLKYLFHRKDPATVSADLARLMRHYGAAWGSDRFLLIGYSLGADMLPAMINGLPPDLRGSIAALTLLGPARSYDLEFHFTEWLWDYHKGNPRLLPEAAKLQGIRILCVYGEEESESLCPELPPGKAKLLPLKGGHHFGGAIRTIVDSILESDSTGNRYLRAWSPG